MREFKIFFVVLIFTALVYWGVEPYAHSVMHPHVAPANFDFAKEDISFAKSLVDQRQNELNQAQIELDKIKKSNNEEAIKSAEAKLQGASEALEKAQKYLGTNEWLWERVDNIDLAKGDANRGSEFFQTNCSACHSLKIAGLESAIPDSSAYGVMPPDLSASGLLYDEKFFAALIMYPSLALKVDHKFGDAFIMTAYNEEMSGEEREVVSQNVADVIAYLKEVGKDYEKGVDEGIRAELNDKYAKMEDLSEAQREKFIEKDFVFAKNKHNFVEACGRCHNMRYDDFKALSDMNDLKGYLGSVPPDLSIMIRSRSTEYLNNFINNTQKVLPGTAMPRVGLTQEAQTSVIAYMEQVGDSKKEERQSLGVYIMIFFVILSVFAILWKRKVWSELH
ncbi:c-type cytochrome [Campylobacter troglodytis]|uniref:c-type cytochrome n=1 Tax=Campylobacter troglodytis TaxID=654363 RepID=UPI00115A266F|nr:c-type cytochrome [Campylobacter troglodytis]TQR60531.1 cytochrome C [Campylobacter troglodytis]